MPMVRRVLMNSPSVTYDLFFLLNFYQKRILFNNVKYIYHSLIPSAEAPMKS